MIYEICPELVREGNYDAAFKSAKTVKEPIERYEIVSSIIKEMYSAGQTEAARAMAEQLWKFIDADPPKDRFDNLNILAKEQLWDGDPEGAKRTAKYAGTGAANLAPKERVENLFLQATMAAAAGDPDACQRLAASAEAIKLSDDEIAGSIVVANEPKDPNRLLRYGWGDIARAYSSAGKFDEALDAAAKFKSDVYADLAIDMAKHGLLARSVSTLTKMKSDYDGTIVRSVAREAVQHCNLPDLQQWIKSINDPISRSYAALGAAEGLSKSDHDLDISGRPSEPDRLDFNTGLGAPAVNKLDDK